MALYLKRYCRFLLWTWLAGGVVLGLAGSADPRIEGWLYSVVAQTKAQLGGEAFQ